MAGWLAVDRAVLDGEAAQVGESQLSPLEDPVVVDAEHSGSGRAATTRDAAPTGYPHNEPPSTLQVPGAQGCPLPGRWAPSGSAKMSGADVDAAPDAAVPMGSRLGDLRGPFAR